MKKLLLGLVLVASVAQAQAEDPAIADAKARIAMKMKDPESARFTDLVLVDKGKAPLVCGWINAKNSYGGYVGYKPFYVLGNIVEIRDDADAGMLNNHITFDAFWKICSPDTGESFGTELVALPKANPEKYCAKLAKAVGAMTYDCPKVEMGAKAWLEAHGTSGLIASRCSREARQAGSYTAGRSCVEREEAEIIFSRGPRVAPVANAGG